MRVQSQFIEMFGNPLSSKQKNELKKLGECCCINPRRPNITLHDTDKVSFVPMSAVSEDGHLLDILDEEYGKVKKGFTYFENNDVLFAKITPCMENGKGAIAQGLTNGIGMGSTEFHVLRPINEISSPYWLLALTQMPVFRERAAKNMSGTGGQKRVAAAYLEHFMVGVPSIEEQRHFEAIYKQTDKSKFVGFKSQFIEMFTNKGYPLKALRTFAEISTGSTPSKKQPQYWENGDKPWVSAQDMKCKYVSKTEEWLTDMGFSKCKILPVDTLMYVCRGSIGVMAINKIECATNQSICSAICDKSKCNVDFLYHSLLYKKDSIKSIGEGTSFKSLSQSTFADIKIELPPIVEQNRFVSIAKQADKSKYYN